MAILRVGILGILIMAIAVIFGPQVIAGGDGARPLTPDWIERAAQKERARAADPRAIRTSPRRAPKPAGPETPARLLARQVVTSKAEMLQRFELRRASVEAYIAALVASGATPTAERLRNELTEELQRIQAYPDGEITIDVPALETGGHSITLSIYDYDSSYQIKDPISFTFYNVGSSWDAWYDLQNFTTPKWSNETLCAGSQQAYTWDAVHGGTDGWEYQDYHLIYNGPCSGPRYHMRLYDRGYTDTHGQYGRWSFSSPHHDRFPDHCVDDWEGAQEVLHQSFIDDYGQKHLFVGAMYQVNWGNAGTYSCAGASADSWGWYVEFLY